MNITSIKPQIRLRTIDLKSTEIKEAMCLLKDLGGMTNANKYGQISEKLFDIFDSHIKEKAKNMPEFIYKEDFLQRIYLKFFELLEEIKNRELSPEDFFESLDKIKPNDNDIKPGFDWTSSLENYKYENNDKLRVIDLITEDDLPIYLQSPEPQKIEISRKKLHEIFQNSNLGQLEKQIMSQKAAGNNGKEISAMLKINPTKVCEIIRTSLKKIQEKNNILPEDFKKFITDFKREFAVEKSEEEIKKIFIDNAFIFRDYENALEKVRGFAKFFEIECNVAAKAFLEMPDLFRHRLETMLQKVNNFSEFSGIDIEKVKKIYLNSLHLLTLAGENGLENCITNISKALKTDTNKTIKAFLSYVNIISNSPEELLSNIEKNSKYLGISTDKYKKFGLLNPKLLCFSKEVLQNKVKETSELLGISEKEYLKYLRFQPSALMIKPETIHSNVENIANAFNVPFKDAVKIAIYNPVLLYSKIDTIVSNLDKTADLIGMDKNAYYKLALRQPTLMTRTPETINGYIQGHLKIFGFEKEEFFKILENYPMLTYTTVDTQLKRAKLMQYYKEISGTGKLPLKETAKTNIAENKICLNILYKLISRSVQNEIITKKNYLAYLNEHPKLNFKFTIPQHECTETFVNFIKDFSNKTYNRQRFEFVIE